LLPFNPAILGRPCTNRSATAAGLQNPNFLHTTAGRVPAPSQGVLPYPTAVPGTPGKPADSTNLPKVWKKTSSIAMSSFHHHTPSFPPSDDSFWDVPRLYKDKIHRENAWPVTAVRPLPRRNVDVPESPKRVTLLDYKSKSGTAVPTLKSFGTKLSPTASIDMSMSRFSVDGASISGSFHSQNDRPESIAKNLRAKGSRFMRRQNSRFNLRTMEWVEDSNETWTRGTARHNRDQSTGNSKLDQTVFTH